MPSFDVVSELDTVETKNAVDNANRDLATRFDFKGVDATFEYVQETVVIKAESEFQLQQLQSMLRDACSKRGVDTSALDPQKIDHTGRTFKQTIGFKQGIEQSIAKKMVKLIKDKKLKVQAAIQGEKLRVTGKKRDDLQQVMALLKAEDFGQPLQFNNFRD
ncbi:MAG: YajQ family cyclic di-GMP-binding protein [Glaciecola sp.]